VATGNDPVVALEDVNGDRRLDLVTCGEHGVGVKPGVWSFTPHSHVDEHHGVALGDFDGDGKTDVAAAKGRALMVVRCDGSGGFIKAQRLTLPDLKYPAVFAGDVNGDWRPTSSARTRGRRTRG